MLTASFALITTAYVDVSDAAATDALVGAVGGGKVILRVIRLGAVVMGSEAGSGVLPNLQPPSPRQS
jgi:hypothetical protein